MSWLSCLLASLSRTPRAAAWPWLPLGACPSILPCCLKLVSFTVLLDTTAPRRTLQPRWRRSAAASSCPIPGVCLRGAMECGGRIKLCPTRGTPAGRAGAATGARWQQPLVDAFFATAIPSACGPCSLAKAFFSSSLQQERGLRLLPLPEPALLPRQGQGRHVVSAGRVGLDSTQRAQHLRCHGASAGASTAQLTLQLACCTPAPQGIPVACSQVRSSVPSQNHRRPYGVAAAALPRKARPRTRHLPLLGGQRSPCIAWVSCQLAAGPQSRARHVPVLVEAIFVFKPSTVCKPSAERGVPLSGPASLTGHLWHCPRRCWTTASPPASFGASWTVMRGWTGETHVHGGLGKVGNG